MPLHGEDISDEPKRALLAGDLSRMIAARAIPTTPVVRHFLLQTIVQATYGRRYETRLRRVCLDTGFIHLDEFPDIVPALRTHRRPPRDVTSFKFLAIVLVEDERVDEAIAVCERAVTFGFGDGTLAGYSGRLERLRRKAVQLRSPSTEVRQHGVRRLLKSAPTALKR